MQRIVVTTLAAIAGIVLLPALAGSAQAGDREPISVSKGKREAKNFAEEYCDTHSRCSKYRVSNCRRVSRHGVDCDGAFLLNETVCTFEIRVRSVESGRIRTQISGINCTD